MMGLTGWQLWQRYDESKRQVADMKRLLKGLGATHFSGKKKEDLEAMIEERRGQQYDDIGMEDPAVAAQQALIDGWFLAPLKATKSLASGKANEPRVLAELRKFLRRNTDMEAFAIFDVGLVCSSARPFCGTSVDGVILAQDKITGQWLVLLLEIKSATGPCPLTHHVLCSPHDGSDEH